MTIGLPIRPNDMTNVDNWRPFMARPGIGLSWLTTSCSSLVSNAAHACVGSITLVLANPGHGLSLKLRQPMRHVLVVLLISCELFRDLGGHRDRLPMMREEGTRPGKGVRRRAGVWREVHNRRVAERSRCRQDRRTSQWVLAQVGVSWIPGILKLSHVNPPGAACRTRASGTGSDRGQGDSGVARVSDDEVDRLFVRGLELPREIMISNQHDGGMVHGRASYSIQAEYVLQSVRIACQRTAAVDQALILVGGGQIGEGFADPGPKLPKRCGRRNIRKLQRTIYAHRRRHYLEVDGGLVGRPCGRGPCRVGRLRSHAVSLSGMPRQSAATAR